MATNAHLALENFIYRIEAISPSDTTTSRSTFRYADVERLEPDEMPQAMRLFSIAWQGSDPDMSPTCMHDRWADHTVEVSVYYPVGAGGMNTLTLQKMMLQDRHDIAKALRDPDNFDGYESANASTDVGIKNRVLVGDALDRNNTAVWAYKAHWRITIQEVE